MAVDNFCTTGNEKILATAGGRAELRLWLVTLDKGALNCIELACHLLKGNDRQRQKNWREHHLIGQVSH